MPGSANWRESSSTPTVALVRHESASDHAAVVAAMRAHLDAHCTRVVTLAELARLTGFSPFHVCRLFSEAVGVPPYAYLVRARLERARAMVAAGEPLSAVAYATGFSDQSHLTRHFKRAFGVTPGQYARWVANLAPAAHERAS